MLLKPALQRQFRVGQVAVRKPLQQAEELPVEPEQLHVAVGGEPGAAGILDVLLPREHVRHVARHRAAGAEQVHLEHQRVHRVEMVEQVLQRRVGDEAAVPYQSVPMRIIGSAGGSAPLAITCSGMIVVSALSK